MKKTYIITNSMSRKERIKLFHSVAQRLFNSRVVKEMIPKKMKSMRRTNASKGVFKTEYQGLTFLVFVWSDGAFEFFSDIGTNTSEYAKLTVSHSVAVYTQHYFMRYNERKELGLTSIKEILQAFVWAESMTMATPVELDESKILVRTKTGFGHGSMVDYGFGVMFMNTWFDLDEVDENVKLAKTSDQFNELSSAEKDNLALFVYNKVLNGVDPDDEILN